MNKEAFVKNVKMYCAKKGIRPTPACKECGVGGSFLNNIERGQRPSVDAVQRLAKYLGVTTSDLLGEKITADGEVGGMSEEMKEIVNLYDKASPELQAAALTMLRAAEAARSAPGAEQAGA